MHGKSLSDNIDSRTEKCMVKWRAGRFTSLMTSMPSDATIGEPGSLTSASEDGSTAPAGMPPDPGHVVTVCPEGVKTGDRPAAWPLLAGTELATARRYADASRAPSTQRAYAADWRRFAAWCLARGARRRCRRIPRVVAVFLSAEADFGAAPLTIGRRLAAIGWMHRRAGLQPPQAREGASAILEVMAGIRRSHGVAPTQESTQPTPTCCAISCAAIPGDDLRSRARPRGMLTFGMAGAFRRSELVALQFG